MENVAYIISNSGAMTITMDGKRHNVSPDHPNLDEISQALKSKNYSSLGLLLDIPELIEVKSGGKVQVTDGIVYYNGEEVHNALSDRIIGLIADNLPVDFMIQFLENMVENPSKTAVDELYLFLEHNSIPVTEDGCFLAYRRVTEDYLDFYTKSVDNSIGATPSMFRNMVDDKRDKVCSSGYHFCSFAYLPYYHGQDGRVVIVKINPKDVVSIPSDYDNAKGRCCAYEVVGEADEGEVKDVFDKAGYAADGGEYVESLDGDREDEGEDDECPDCGEYEDDCTCNLCSVCGGHEEDCTCNDDDPEGDDDPDGNKDPDDDKDEDKEAREHIKRAYRDPNASLNIMAGLYGSDLVNEICDEMEKEDQCPDCGFAKRYCTCSQSTQDEECPNCGEV